MYTGSCMPFLHKLCTGMRSWSRFSEQASKEPVVIWTPICELLQRLPAQWLMALQAAKASETLYGQWESQLRFSVSHCRTYPNLNMRAKSSMNNPPLSPHPRSPLQWSPGRGFRTLFLFSSCGLLTDVRNACLRQKSEFY